MRALTLVLALCGCVPRLVQDALTGNVASMKAQLAKKPAPQKTKDEALVEAVMAGHDEAAGVLLDAGANPQAADELKTPALTLAIKRDDVVAVTLLLDHKADLAASLDAVRYAKYEVATTLLDRGLDPNAKDSEGGAGLAYAACAGRRDLVELYLARGADPAKAGKACLRERFDVEAIKTVCDDYGTPLECARHRGDGAIQKLLEGAGKK